MAHDRDTRDELAALLEGLEQLGYVVEERYRLVSTGDDFDKVPTGEVTITISGWRPGYLQPGSPDQP